MNKKLRIHYDEEVDYLELQIGEPKDGYFDEVSNGVFQRRDQKTDEVIGIAIFNFKKRTGKKMDVEVKLPVGIQLTV